MNETNLAASIAEYAALGHHRTGTPADEATSQWLLARLAERGAAHARTPPFACTTLNVHEASLVVGGVRIDGTPLWDGSFTTAAGVRAALRPLAQWEPGCLAVVHDVTSASLRSHPALAEPQRVAGLVIVSGDPEGQVMLLNAEQLATPLAVPVLQVARRDADALLQALASGGGGGSAQAQLVVRADRLAGSATNVVAEVPGSAAASGAPLILLTPKSGWFACAAERGSGIAIVLALVAHAASAPGPRRPLKVLFTSGHEQGYAGLKALLAEHPELNDQAAEWLHVGASLGARHPTSTHLFSRHAQWREWMVAALAQQGLNDVVVHAPEVAPVGEGSVIAERRFISIMGAHRYFHSAQDVPEVAVDVARTAGFGRAWLKLLEMALRT